MATTPAHDTTLSLRDYLAILRRRKWLFVLPAALVFALALAFALLQTSIYRSEATILIEDAQVPEDLMTTLVGRYLEERLEAISRRVMVTDSLLAIAERYNLYVEERRRLPINDVVEAMRRNIHRKMIRTDVIDPRSGQERSVTVAFTLAFDHPDPTMAQRITNELVSLYLNENLRRRRELATGTMNFFRGERERTEARIAEVERQLAEFKQANSGSLPEQLPYNQQITAQLEQELRELDRQARSLQERASSLQIQLTLTEPLGGGGGQRSPAAELESKRTGFTTLRARYGPEHPDVVKLQREIAALEQTVGGGRSTDTLDRERARLLGELDALRGRYADDHPDVRRMQRELEGIEAELLAARNRPGGGNNAGPQRVRADNPAYIQLQAQLDSTRAELAAVQEQRRRVAERLEQRQQLVLRIPLVEREYAQLRRTLEDTMALRDELARKETAATLGQTLEAELKAERLTLIEPPSLPTTPVKPNRGLIALIGFVLALGCGAGCVGIVQTLDATVYSKDIAAIIGEAPLVVVPQILTATDRTRSWATASVALLVAAGGLSAALWLVHTRYAPLDIAYYDLQRRVLMTLEP
ncbi:MAG TPA: Wzz/FepE/Etk N-terminal domain-containing protein [Geminicoccaceae bacterium]|nr:Wzz/FepE/Etk N-terminal domain-containing protein [Geminicoccaceae bacterium]